MTVVASGVRVTQSIGMLAPGYPWRSIPLTDVLHTLVHSMWTLRAWYISKCHAWWHKTATFDNLKGQCHEKCCSVEALERGIRPDHRPHLGFTFSCSAVKKLRQAFNSIQYQSADCNSFWKSETGLHRDDKQLKIFSNLAADQKNVKPRCGQWSGLIHLSKASAEPLFSWHCRLNIFNNETEDRKDVNQFAIHCLALIKARAHMLKGRFFEQN